MAKKGIGVIGCGGRITGVLKNIAGRDEIAEIRAACDPVPEQVERFRQTFNPALTVYRDYQDLVRDPAIDWVFIGSWNCFHRDHAVAALEAGKNVFCEKPLATNLADCLAIRDAWQASGRLFSMGFTLRYSPHYRKVQEVVAAGTIGRILSMEFNETLHFDHGGYIHGDWRRLTRNAGTHLLEKCCHDIDLAHWITGDIPVRAASFGGTDFFRPENRCRQTQIGLSPGGKPAYATWSWVGGPGEGDPFTEDKDIVDNQVAILEFAGGARATFHTNCNTNLPERRMYICGTLGTLRADLIAGSIEVVRIGYDQAVERPQAGVKGGHGGGDKVLGESLARSIADGAEPFTGAMDGLKAAITCFGIDQAMTTGQVVDLRPFWRQAGIELRCPERVMV